MKHERTTLLGIRNWNVQERERERLGRERFVNETGTMYYLLKNIFFNVCLSSI